MGMIVFARDYCGFPLSKDFRGALRQMQNGRWVEVFRENFEAGKRMGQASSALGGKKFFCFSTCVAHGPKRRGGSGAFRYCQ